MTKRFATPVLLVCTALSVACVGERVFGPDRGPVFTTLELRPIIADLFVVAPGNTVELSTRARDETGVTMPGPGAVTYASSAPGIAKVSSSGVVTAVAPGKAVITATVTFGRVARTASMTATVLGYTDAPGAYPAVAGVYDLSAPITGFDPAWGDATGCRYSAILTLEQLDRERFAGTYSDLHVVCPGESDDWRYTGFVTGSVDPYGRVAIQLIGGNHTWTSWSGWGKLASQEIVGQFGCCGHISGTFTVKPRGAD